jgi:hypothetical protein
MANRKRQSKKPAQVSAPEPEPVVAEAPVAESGDAAAEKRYTRSFTPERGYDTVALVGIVAPTSLAVDAETMAKIEAAIAEAAIAILQTNVPALTIVGTESSKRWTRVQGDTAETHKVTTPRATGGKRLDAMFETTIDVTKLIVRAKELVTAGQSKRDAMLAAAAEQNATDEQLRSLGLVVAVKKAVAATA